MPFKTDHWMGAEPRYFGSSKGVQVDTAVLGRVQHCGGMMQP